MTFGWLLLEIGIACLAVLVAGPGVPRQVATFLVLLAGATVALLSPSLPLLRVCLAFVVLLAFLTSTRLALRRGPSLSPPMRLLQLVSLFDVAAARPLARQPSWPLLRDAIGPGVAAALAFVALQALPGRLGPLAGATRVALGCVLLYGLLGLLSEVPRLAHALGGVSVPRNQRAPILSSSLAEFWGRRWNRFVGGWLNDLVFRPLARRHRPTLGLLAAFGASAALHAWAAFVPLGGLAALQMAAYFLVEGVLLVAERSLRLPSWPKPAARVWTLLAVAGPSPLGIDPFLRTLGL